MGHYFLDRQYNMFVLFIWLTFPIIDESCVIPLQTYLENKKNKEEEKL